MAVSYAHLPAFNDMAECRKCGSGNVAAQYTPEYQAVHAMLAVLVGHYMKRICVRCGFSWAERPLDEVKA